jgi:hypothetical protein
MAMETHVFFRGKLPSKAALSRALKELGFPLAIKPATGSLEQQAGFMPMTFWHEETGAEFDAYNGNDALADFANLRLDPRFDRRASFRWGGDAHECAAGTCGAAALAKLVGGVVFDEQENRLLSIDDAIAVATKYLATVPQPKKVRRRRPRGRSTLEQILAPLLAKRSDLALVGKLLLIRPVRHLARGAVFRWFDRKRELNAYPLLWPLYEAPYYIRFHDAVFSGSVYDPGFEPELFDRLAGDLFAHMGKVAALDEYDAKFLERTHGWEEVRFATVLLSKGVERAGEYLARFESDGRDEVRRARLEGDRTALFAHYHAKEAETARVMNIEHLWEPTPFPAEVSDGQRAASHDPIFTPTPWLEFPAGWRHLPPKKPGELLFGGDWWRRDNVPFLISPRTREEAEHRHRNCLPYQLMTWLPEGHAFVQSYWTCSNPAREADGSLKPGEPRPSVIYRLQIFSSGGRHMRVDFDQSRDDGGLLEMGSIGIEVPKREQRYAPEMTEEWYSFLGFRDNEKVIHDYRTRPKTYERRKMTEADRAAYIFPLPAFGEIDALWQCIALYLRNEGCGVFR